MPYTIRQVSERTGLPVSTLRYYEAEQLLQPRQPARDGGFGQAELVGRGGEAALGHDAGEDEQVVGVDLFHLRNNHVLRGGLMQSPASNTLQSIPSPSQRTSS